MTKKLLIILLVVVIGGGAVIGGTFAWRYWQVSKLKEEPIGYKTVTIKELTSDTTKYDGQKILVRGKFTDMTNRPIPECFPTGTGENPEIKESYRVYSSTWGIYNRDEIIRTIGVEVIDENGIFTSTLPNYQESQEIELRGVARATTVSSYCNYDIRYRSVYIEINAKDIDITLKPLPKTFPNWKTYLNEEYGYEVKYPEDWNLTSWNVTNPSNPGYNVLVKNNVNDKEFVIISVTMNYPFLPDFDVNASLSQKSIGGLKAQEQVFPDGYCDILSCTDPFMGLWVKNKGYIYTLRFNDTTTITGVYNQMLSTFKFIE